MDNESIRKELECFQGVWELVSASNAPADKKTLPAPITGGASRDQAVGGLCSFIDQKAASAPFFCHLSALHQQADKATLAHIADNEWRSLRELRLEYFLLTGARHHSPPSCPFVKGGLGALRQACLSLADSENQLQLAAANADNRFLGALYSEIAQRDKKNVRLIKNLMERMF